MDSSLCFLQVKHLRESVTEEYARYLNEHAARKLLLAKLNDLHNEQLEMTQQAQRRESADLCKNPSCTETQIHTHEYSFAEEIQSISELSSDML